MIIEKSMDYFEYGIKTLMAMYDFQSVEHVDALSLRCFAFTRNCEVTEWFRPVITCQEAVQRLAKLLNLNEYWKVVRYQTGQELPANGCVIGPVRGNIFLPDLKTYYYHGDTVYFYCRKSDSNTFLICDFSGVPDGHVEVSELNRILEKNVPYLIWLEPWKYESPPEYKLDYRQLLRDGLIFHEISVQNEKVKGLKCQKFGSQYVSFRYAIMNYGIQMRKMVDFVDAAVGLEEKVSKTINKLWIQLPKIGTDADVEAISEWEDRIWSVIFNYAEDKGIVL